MPARFRNDFDTTLDQPLLLPIGLEGVERHVAHQCGNALAGLDHVGQARDEGSGHQKTSTAACSMRRRNTGCRLSRVMMSARRPRMAEALSLRSISSYRPSLP